MSVPEPGDIPLETAPGLITETRALNFANHYVGGSPFVAEFRGLLRPKYTERYIITAEMDDGIVFYVGGAEVLRSWKLNSVWESPRELGRFDFQAGRYYAVRVLHSNGGYSPYTWINNPHLLRLFWSSPSQPSELIPAVFRPPRGGWDTRPGPGAKISRYMRALEDDDSRRDAGGGPGGAYTDDINQVYTDDEGRPYR